MRWCPIVCALLLAIGLQAQLLSPEAGYDRADSLRGSIGPERAWWNVKHYDISVRPDPGTKSIAGKTTITFEAIANGQRMQIDLQQPLVIDSIVAEITTFWESGGSYGTPLLSFAHQENVVWVEFPDTITIGTRMPIHIHYHGVPREARTPPWDGGWVWSTDRNGAPWVSVTCQGLGASVWFPCKDHQSDEPDNGASLRITVPDTLKAIGNGRLKGVIENDDGTATWHWAVTSPINSYNIIPYIGKYAHFQEEFTGAEGKLDLDYWVLEQDLVKAKEHFKQVPPMMECFEEYLGPFPWYEDGFKLVQAPYLGMEHQSAIAYGNGFQNGYRGMDISRSGHGLDFDYIIVHETGHEWFGNSITTADIADMWVQEGFTVYTEVAYVECTKGKKAAAEYLIGIRRNITNDRPVIAPYGVNEEGSTDMYYKGAAVVHMVRAIMNDDEKFWRMIRDMTSEFEHSIVTSEVIEKFMDDRVDPDLAVFFDQYLRTTRVPRLEWRVEKRRLYYRWAAALNGFAMPVDVSIHGKEHRLQPTTEWKEFDGKVRKRAQLGSDPAFYITVARVKG